MKVLCGEPATQEHDRNVDEALEYVEVGERCGATMRGELFVHHVGEDWFSSAPQADRDQEKHE